MPHPIELNHHPHNHHQHKRLQRIRALSRLLDSAISIPGTPYHVGIDPILGLVPGGGDTIGFLLSAYIVLEAIRFQLPRETLIRMVINLLIDTVVGSVPVLGDVFDFTWKANTQNVALLEAHLKNPRPQQAADRWFVAGLVVAITLIGVGIVTLIVIIIKLLIHLF